MLELQRIQQKKSLRTNAEGNKLILNGHSVSS